MVKFLINRPIGVIMTYLALIILGIYASTMLPISLLPSINIPEITVRISNPGKPAEEIERSLTQPLRMQLIQLSGIHDLESDTRDGEATIKMSFDYGKDVDMLFVEVNEKVDAAMAELPRDLPRPRVIKASATDLPVFNVNIAFADTLSITHERMMELSQLANRVFRKRFEQLPHVALADITGMINPEILIEPHPGKLVALGVTPKQISEAIQQSMLGRGSIRYREGQMVFDVIIEQKVTTPDDIASIRVNSGNRIFKISDLAQVKLQPTRLKGMYLHNGQPAICMPLIKSTNARMGDMKSSVDGMIKTLEKEYPNLSFTLSQDQTEVLSFAISNLSNSLVAGIILAVSIMFLFLGDYKSPVLMGITIPVSLVIGMIFFQLIGISLNIVSLSGLILGVGMMIDNSIIVIDNITQWRKRGHELEQAVTGATNEVITPLLSSMLTTCAVFVPLIFLSGMAGAMFFDQAMAIAIGLGASFWVSVTLMPTLYFGLHKRNAHKWTDRESLVKLERAYDKGHHFVFGHSKIFIVLVVVLVAMLPLLFMKMEKRQMPELTRNEMIANISWGGNVSLEENMARCQRILGWQRERTAESAFFVGRQQLILLRGMDMDESDASLYFKAKEGVPIEVFEREMQAILANQFPDATLSIGYPESVFNRVFPAPDAGLVVKVGAGETGGLPAVHQIDSLASELERNFPSASLEMVPVQSHMQLEYNSEAMSLYGVPLGGVQDYLEVSFRSNRIGSLAFDQQVIPIIFGDSLLHLESVITSGFVKGINEVEVPVRHFITPKTEVSFRSIYGDKTSAFIPIKVNASSKTLERMHSKLLEDDVSNTALNYSYRGEIFQSRAMVWELIGVLLVSVLLLYFILAAQFESVLQPLIVLIELPLDIAVTLLVLWAAGVSINLMSMIGFIVMGGVVVNDSILKIDMANRLRKEGMPLDDAISTSGHRRIKSITTTSLTTILALVPILFGHDLGSELQRPMAITLIAGMTVGTLVSVYIMPLIYWITYRKRG